MNRYSKSSLSKLYECDRRLITLFELVLPSWDHTILCGHRSPEDQVKAFNARTSLVKKGKHNIVPSEALDACPYPFDFKEDWSNIEILRSFGGFVLGVAHMSGIKVRWGGDWDRDWNFKEHRFKDLYHFELETETV